MSQKHNEHTRRRAHHAHAATAAAIPHLYQAVSINRDDLTSVRVDTAAHSRIKREGLGHNDVPGQHSAGAADDQALRVAQHKRARNAI